jgi:hypothetical protein
MELDNSSEDWDTAEQQNESASPNDPILIRPIWWGKKMIEKGLMIVNIVTTRRNKGRKKM